MKIGILTYHRAHNYGAVLQCYALSTYLTHLGHDVVVIDYCPKYFKYGLFVWYKWFSLNPYRCIEKLITQIKTFGIQKRRYNAFERFIDAYIVPKFLDLDKEQYSIDCYILGSDQIWRKNKGVFDPIFWGDFKAAKHAKLVSYAASMGNCDLSDEEKKQIGKWLRAFSFIFVREIPLKHLLSSLTDKKIEVVIDPTFLLSHIEWHKISVNPKYKRRYVLVYQVIENLTTLMIAREAARVLNADIVEIASKVKKEKVDHKMVYDASPNEFIGLIAHAAMVVTTSFHGTAFSIIFRKPFVSIKQHAPSDLRIESVLKTCDLQNRFVDCEKWTWTSDFLNNINPRYDAIEFSKKQLELL